MSLWGECKPRSFQRAAKGLRRLRCRRGAKRRPRQPDQEGFEVPLGPFEAAEAAVVELPSGSDFAVPVVRNALSKLNVDSDFLAWYRRSSELGRPLILKSM